MPATALPDKIQLPSLKRYVTIAPVKPEGGAIVNTDTREATFSVSSELPLKRINWDIWDYVNEVLLHEDSAVDMSRLNSGAAPVLWNHDTNQIRGVVVRGWLSDRKLYCQVRFSSAPESQQLMADINDGIINNVSIGYRIKELQLTERSEDGLDTWSATDWEVLEVSMVSVPADPTVGPTRSAEDDVYPVLLKGDTMARQPVNPDTQEPDYSAADVEAMQRQIAELKAQSERDRQEREQERAQREAIEKRAQVTERFYSLRQRGEKLVGELKLSTAAFEELFGIEQASQRSLIDGMVENPGKADQIEFFLSMQEKTAAPPANLGRSVVGQTPLPPAPSERATEQQQTPEEIQAAAQRLYQRALNQQAVI